MIKKSDLIIIDVEASGLTQNSYPIEIGVYGYNINYSNLIIPEDNWTSWDLNSEKIHKLKREQLFEEGIVIKKIADDLNALLYKKTVYSDAANWDSFWIDLLFEKANTYKCFEIKSIYNISKKNNKKEFLFNRNLIFIEELKKGNERHRVSLDTKVIHAAAIKTFF